MPILFGVTMFVSASLLFLIQPMVGKMVLPLLGGTPAVWNSCMVFFQALLLAGYYYSHRTSQQFTTRTQVMVHAAVLVGAVAVLLVGAALSENHSPVPIVKSLAPQGSTMPFFGVLALLAAAIGLPFFTVSTTAPLLQKWFSETGHPSAKDPYFLYAASNFGSLLSLLLYPILIEPKLRLVEQAWLFAGGFIVLAVMIVLCGRIVRGLPAAPKRSAAETARDDANAPTLLTKLRWLILAAVPSSLMLSVTTDVATDIVSMPMLWIVPLALYLITFIIVFSKKVPAVVHLTCCLLTPVVILLVVFMKTSQNIYGTNTGYLSFKAQLGIQFAAFFLVTMTCHGELARTRPSPKYLTNFYLLMSVGGMVGGIFNALVAPVVFTFISEYPITLVAACLVLPRLSEISETMIPKEPVEHPKPSEWSWVWTVVIVAAFFLIGRLVSKYYADLWYVCNWCLDTIGANAANPRTAATIVGFGVPVLACYAFVERPLRLGLCVGVFWLGTFLTFLQSDHEDGVRPLYTRSFFGTMKVEPNNDYHRLVHGTTLHGLQHAAPDGRSLAQAMWLFGANNHIDALSLGWIADPQWKYPGREPLTYYHRSGPVGSMFEEYFNRVDRKTMRNTDVACIGLGTGSLSCYGRPGQKLTFFEIDWTVRKIAENPEYFTYLSSAREQDTEIEFLMGDARLTLEEASQRKWGFMLVDAFSSDSIPAHLLTKEAVQLFFDRVEDDSIVALHISNRYLKLEPVVERIVRELGYEALVMHDYLINDRYEVSGKSSSTWVAVAKKKEHLGALQTDSRWGALKRDDKIGLWTDDYTPIINVLTGDWDLFSFMK